MDISQDLTYFVLGALGALSGEIMKVYELRGKLTTKKYRALAKSPVFWTVFVGMILSSGFIAWAVSTGTSNPTPIQVIFSGIGARAVIRQSAETRNANRPLTAGAADRDTNTVTLSDLLS